MPEMGETAIDEAATIGRTARYDFGVEDILETRPTIKVGMVSDGLNNNSVPNLVRFTIDVPTSGGLDRGEIEASHSGSLGAQIQLRKSIDMMPASTRGDDPLARCVFDAVENVTRRRPAGSDVLVLHRGRIALVHAPKSDVQPS
ncbi:hypothetical protein CIC12_24400 [Burkholderia sp. SG-MS1]|nr:hypothetical protein [Paraburkholderia sp. SG-MS1]